MSANHHDYLVGITETREMKTECRSHFPGCILRAPGMAGPLWTRSEDAYNLCGQHEGEPFKMTNGLCLQWTILVEHFPSTILDYYHSLKFSGMCSGERVNCGMAYVSIPLSRASAHSLLNSFLPIRLCNICTLKCSVIPRLPESLCDHPTRVRSMWLIHTSDPPRGSPAIVQASK